MGKGFSLTVLDGWLAPSHEAASRLLDGLLAHEKLLLFSEGSMTLELELLTGKRVDVELKLKDERPLTGAEAEFLGVAPGVMAVEREVWLVAGGTKLLYAHTLIPVQCLDKEVRRALDEKSSEPLGRVLSSRGILFAKERLEAGRVRCEAASKDLELNTGASLYARRYILYNKGTRNWVIKAAVTEVFSPALIGAEAAAK
ncbi:MAG: chorismate lyase [Deltaproteobacteria bacterium]|nr:chorismate lyase [Deltaproteobacteria bacterium]